jgi:methionyl aminopeptidase
MVDIKSKLDVERMKVAGKLASDVLVMIEPYVTQGISTEELDQICHDYIVNKQKAIPAPLNYKGFPKSICTSVNHQVCHGIPADTSKMFFVGKPSVLANRLCKITQECMYKAIKIVKPGLHIGNIGAIIQEHAHTNNFSVVRDYCGHGIGRNFHESPQILHYGVDGTGIRLQEGMTFTIEPMINSGKYKTKTLNDGWTVVTQDHSLSAQWEHTILVTNNGYEVLTIRDEEKGI